MSQRGRFGRSVRWKHSIRILTVVISVAPWTIGARAEPSRIGFTTLLREGPGIRYRPTDEALSGKTVEVLECREAWCRVAYGDQIGWVAQATLSAASRVAPMSSPDRTCFVEEQSGYHGGPDVRFCTASPAAK